MKAKIHDFKLMVDDEYVGVYMAQEKLSKIVHHINMFDELVKGLEEAIDAVRVFHGPGLEIYEEHAPEMKRWKSLLAKAKVKT